MFCLVFVWFAQGDITDAGKTAITNKSGKNKLAKYCHRRFSCLNCSFMKNRFFAHKTLWVHFTVKEKKSQNMAIYAVFLIAVCLSTTSAVHKPCGVGQCKLVLVGQNPAVAFQQLASEDGVRLVYLNLEIGNNSIHPLESDERFLAKRWIWAKTIREPMLLMTDDAHDFHSLGLLRRQKRYMTVQLAEQPAGCLANWNVSC